MSADQALVAALGLDGAHVVDRDEYDALPEHRRALVTATPATSGGYAYLRLPDPPPVAALRRIAAVVEALDPADLHGLAKDEPFAMDAITAVHTEARAALTEFDGPTS